MNTQAGDQDDRFDRLAARLDAEPQKWVHEPGDRLLGEVIDVDKYNSEKGYEPSPMVAVEVVTGSTEEHRKPIAAGDQRIFYVSRTTARSEWEKANPAIGDEIGIKYIGIPTGKEYQLYRIRNLSSRSAASEDVDAAGKPDPQAEARFEERVAESGSWTTTSSPPRRGRRTMTFRSNPTATERGGGPHAGRFRG